MTNTHLVLKDVSHVLPDGRALFSGLNEQFDLRPTGLVGRNGVGKTLLARILTGRLQPSSGHCQCTGSVHYLAQHVAHFDDSTVAGLAGIKHRLDALTRIESGSTSPADFDTVGDYWDLPQRFRQALERHGLDYLDTDTPAHHISGGEAMRVSLIGAMLSDADFLILDEPSNHLDRPSRQALIDQLQHWQRGLIVVSHDRQLLESMERIIELSPHGLQSYGGNYSFYAKAKAHQHQNALQHVAEEKLERQRNAQVLQKQRERQERRQSQGSRQGKTANQAKILLGRQKERSEVSSGALQKQHAASRVQADLRVYNAAQQVKEEAQIVLHQIPIKQAARRCVAELNRVVLPYVKGPTRTIDLLVTGQQRIGIVGANGCGKSTLLQVLSGQRQPLTGNCKVTTESAYLNQRLDNLDPTTTVLEQLQFANRSATEADLRMRLAQLGLDTQRITTPCGSLSGGERLKAALACILYADSPPQLLLLDEPNNHLDLPSAQALESMLRSYRGALVVASHDDVFLNNLALTDHLLATEHDWSLEQI